MLSVTSQSQPLLLLSQNILWFPSASLLQFVRLQEFQFDMNRREHCFFILQGIIQVLYSVQDSACLINKSEINK